jgi:hypothetical protein
VEDTTRIEMDLKEICREAVKWIELAQDRDKWWEFARGLEVR